MIQPGLQRGNFGLFCLEGAQPSSSPTSERLPLGPSTPAQRWLSPGHCQPPVTTASPRRALYGHIRYQLCLFGQRGRTDSCMSGFSSQLLQEVLQIINFLLWTEHFVCFLLSSSACWDRIIIPTTQTRSREISLHNTCAEHLV